MARFVGPAAEIAQARGDGYYPVVVRPFLLPDVIACFRCREAGAPGGLTLPCHEPGSEHPFCLELVVGAAAQAKVRRRPRGFPSQGHRTDVIEFQEPTFTAAMAIRADEGAATFVTRPHFPLHVGRDVARVRR